MKKVFIILVSLIILGSAAILLIYKNGISKVSNDSTIKEFVVEKGSTYTSISKDLKKQNLIKSELMYKVFIKLNKPSGLEAGKYNLSENMNVREIVKTLSNGSNSKADTVKITFKEGKNMRYIATLIASNTNNTEEDVFNLLKDKEYIDSLVSQYWFLTDDIKKEEIYYPLEGYLFPDTYEFLTDATVKDIFKVMLDQTNNKLNEAILLENSSFKCFFSSFPREKHFIFLTSAKSFALINKIVKKVTSNESVILAIWP